MNISKCSQCGQTLKFYERSEGLCLDCTVKAKPKKYEATDDDLPDLFWALENTPEFGDKS